MPTKILTLSTVDSTTLNMQLLFISLFLGTNVPSMDDISFLRTCLCNERILRSVDFRFHGVEKSNIQTPPIGNLNPFYGGKSLLFLPFLAKKMCRTKQTNGGMRGKPEQLSSPSQNHLVTHTVFFSLHFVRIQNPRQCLV